MAARKTTTKKTDKTSSLAVTKRGRKPSKKVTTEKITEQPAELTESSVDNSRRLRPSKRLTLPLILVLVVIALLYLGSKYFVVAMVDGKPITRIEYYQALDQRYGKDLREQMIAEKLITDEAQKRGISVTDKEVQDEIKKFEQQQGGAGQLDQILVSQGLSRTDFNKLVKLQLLRQKMFANAQVTDQEINQYIEQNKDQLPDLATADASTSAKIKNDVKTQLAQQKTNSDFSAWLKDALQSNRVKRF